MRVPRAIANHPWTVAGWTICLAVGPLIVAAKGVLA